VTDMVEKVAVDKSKAYRLLHPMHTVLVSSGGSGFKPNVMAVAWAMPASMSPPLLAISISPKRHTHRIIRETREFVVNVPTVELLKAVRVSGSLSGRTRDKFAEAGLTPTPAKTVKAPVVAECAAHMECRLHSQFEAGDHTVFVGEILEAYANAGVFADEWDLNRAKLLYHLGGTKFALLNSNLQDL
jgi:flavin reductase (DIM6/NTAB) family NADH-FMN oxidoreductase RutF